MLSVLSPRGLSSGDFRRALEALLVEKAHGLSATTITRLQASWQSDYRAFQNRRPDETEYAYIRVDDVHFNIRLKDDRLCTLVVLWARAAGTKELLAIEDGCRESSESWSAIV